MIASKKLTNRMDQITWILWLILGVALIIAEMFTLGFFLFFFGIAAILAALAAFVGVPFVGQFAIFAVVSIALTAMSRTIFARYLPHYDGPEVKMGVDALPGQIGTVTSPSKGALQEAAVKVYGSVWTAFPVDGETSLVEGEKVEVVNVKGSSIYVRRANRELPDWRQS